MPSLQVLPQVPSFGERLTGVLNQGLKDIGHGINQRNINMSDEAAIRDLGAAKTPLAQFQAFARLSAPKQQSLQAAYGHFAKSQENAKEQAQKSQSADQERQDSFNEYTQNIKRLRELVPASGSTNIPFTHSFAAEKYSPFNRDTYQERQEMDTLAFQFEGLLRKAAGGGSQLSQNVFNAFLQKLPNSRKSERENIGSIDALERIVNSKFGPRILAGEKLSAEEQKEFDEAVRQFVGSEESGGASSTAEVARSGQSEGQPQSVGDVFGKGQVVVTSPAGKRFFPKTREAATKYKNMGWEVTSGS